LDNVARDEGLISALKQQNLGADDSNSFSVESFESQEAANREPSEPVSFASQPIPASDSSFNRVATDRESGNGGQFFPDVIQANSEPDFASLTYHAAWPQVDKFIAEENYQNALRLLSRYYRSTELTGPQRQRLIGWLDALAGKVIFSAEHHLQSTPYTVSNESLDDIGQRWKVPAQLIFNINQANIPVVSAIQPGTELKAIQGPFDAEIDLDQKIMTLFLDDLYAGRFPIVVGISGSPKPGDFQVLVKSATGHSWRDSEGQEYAPGTPENGYGPHWIGLSGSLCIHAVSDSAKDGHHGCIGLSQQDAKDVFGILAEGSSIKIFR
jgi:lipoprotein-anchoring transpeptidase ErfK/SrfK